MIDVNIALSDLFSIYVLPGDLPFQLPTCVSSIDHDVRASGVGAGIAC